MLVSGYNYRSIFEQTGLSFDLNCSINNPTGSGAFGFSGEGNQIQFTFQSGRIYDFENRYVSSYQTNTNFNISGDIENSNYSYYVNQTPVCFNGVKNNFKVQRFFYNASNSVLDTNLRINSADPANYTLSFASNFQIGKTFTGQIFNNNSNLTFKIFSGSLSPTGNFTLNSVDTTISGLKSGNIKLNTVNEVGGYNVTLNLYTNFGLIQQDLLLTGFFNIEDVIILTSNPTSLFISGFRSQTQSSYANLNYTRQIFSGLTVLSGYNNLPLNITLEYSSGRTGEFSGSITGTGYGYNLIGTGYIRQEDFGSRNFDFTGFVALTGQNFRNITYTGFIASTGNRNVTATGIYNFPNLTYPASGFITGLATGYFFYKQNFTGNGYAAATGFNTAWWTGYLTGTGFLFYRDGSIMPYNGPNNPFYLAERSTGFFSGYLNGDLNYRLITGQRNFPTGYSTIAYFPYYDGDSSLLLINVSGTITGAETLVRESGRWNVTGVFTGNITGYTDSYEYITQSPVPAFGRSSGLAYGDPTISGDSFNWTGIFSGDITLSQTTAELVSGILSTGRLFTSYGVFNITGININGSKIITGLYTGLQSGDLFQTDSNGNILTNQLYFVTSGNYINVTGGLGITDTTQPQVYATGRYTFTTGDIFITGFIPNVPIYEKSFSGSFNLLTGVFNTGSGTTYYTGLNFNKNINGYSGYATYDTGSLFNFRFDYNAYIDVSGMVAKLTLSGTGNTIYTTFITGV